MQNDWGLSLKLGSYHLLLINLVVVINYHNNNTKDSPYYIEDFFKEYNVKWWPTPPELPDLNPIENVCGSMKQYLRTYYKPRNLQELKDDIESFWLTLTPEVCKHHINL